MRALALAICLESVAFALPAEAVGVEQQISLPAGTLQDALISLAEQVHVSIGMPGSLPHLQVRAIRGSLTVHEALRRLLIGTGYVAVAAGPNVWRLEHAPALTTPIPRHIPEAGTSLGIIPAPVPQADIVVTAAKRSDPLDRTPIDSAVISGLMLSRLSSLPDSAAVASLDSSLALSNIGPGRNRPFLRGVGDSPFNGETQSTVAVLLDDARVTFNAPDPDLRLIDIDRIELLKGPQGPLYGTGALGGVYRIVPARPQFDNIDASASVGVETLSHGGAGVSGSAMLNLPILQDTLAMRAVAYGGTEPGWIDNDRPHGDNNNGSKLSGLRLALRWRPDADWNVDLGGTLQCLRVKDSQYVPDTGYVTAKRSRSGILPEPHDNDFTNIRLGITGRIGDVDLFSTTSWTAHEVDSALDASPAAATFGMAAPILFHDDRMYHVFNQELRLTSRGDGLRWMLGGSFLRAVTDMEAELTGPNQPSMTVGTLDQEAREWALFGDLGVDLSPLWAVEVGTRLFATDIRNEQTDATEMRLLKSRRRGVSPSASLIYKPNPQHYYFLRAASAFRPRGLSSFAPLSQSEFASDELRSLELGGRWHSVDRTFSTEGVIYGSRWKDIQSDYLLPSGLVATRNSGRALIYGIDALAKWTFRQDWDLSGGVSWQHARVEKPAAGLEIAADRPLPVVPAYKAHLSIERGFPLGAWRGDVGLHGVIVGPTHLSLDPALDRRVGTYGTLSLSTYATRGPWHIGLTVQNMLNSHAETFAYGNPFSFPQARQSVMLRPRAVMLNLRWH